MSIRSYVLAVEQAARDAGIRLPMAKLRDAIARSLFNKPYAPVLAAERASKLPPLVLPPPYIQLACAAYRLDEVALRRAFESTPIVVDTANETASKPAGFTVYLSVHWVTGDRAQQLRAGRELLHVTLSRPLLDVVVKHRLPLARGLNGFRVEYVDHVEHLTNVTSQEVARKMLLGAARSLLFMDATGLQPVTAQKQREHFRIAREIPDHDHLSEWFDPHSGNWVLLDEPYSIRAAERQTWLAHHALFQVGPNWEGIHNPEGCTPYLIAADDALLQRISAALSAVPAMGTAVDAWPHDVAPCGDEFVSPQRIADAKPRKARPGASYRNSRGATPYGGGVGVRSRWRPMNAMPAEAHRQMGAMLRRLDHVPLSWRVGSKVLMMRNRLDEWVYHEHRATLGRDREQDYYYPGADVFPRSVTRTDYLGNVATALELLERWYNDCKPRRELIAALTAVASEIESLPDKAFVAVD